MSRKGLTWTLVSGAAAIFAIAAMIHFWDWLRMVPEGGESGTATVRNLGLLIIAVVALPITLWRSIVANRQAKASQAQASTALEQSATARKSFLNSRFQKGAEMLGDNELYARLGGIYALRKLAIEVPEDYLMEAKDLLCAFVVHTSQKPDQPRTRQDDIVATLSSLGTLRQHGKKIDRSLNFDLMYAKLHDYFFIGDFSSALFLLADVSKCDGTRATFANANFYGADVSNATFDRADLSGANFTAAKLDETSLCGANISGALFSQNGQVVSGLTQAQLDQASADPQNLPILDGAVDARTQLPLVWRGE